MRIFLAVGLLIGFLLGAQPASADESSCGGNATLETVTTTCQLPAADVTTLIATSSSTATYSVRIVCAADADDEVCSNPRLCDDPPNTVLYNVLRSDGGGPATVVGTTCVSGDDPIGGPVITPGGVLTEFQRLKWPESPLNIQPPGGRTLVNLETNFFTSNTQPTSQTITLLGQQVEIEATPSSWTWNHGDGSSQTTGSPGAAYPDLQVTHTYLRVVEALRPSVDTTYSGRYRVNGGAWTAIPGTVTVTGAAGELTVVSARPQLVSAD